MIIDTNPTLFNHIAFVCIFIAILFTFIYSEVQENKELDFNDIAWVIILGTLASGLLSYFWFIVIPIIGFIGGLWVLVLILKKLAKALLLVNAQKSDEKVEK